MAGINIVNIYAATIFQNIIKEGGTMFVSVPTAGIFVGVSGFIGAFTSNFTVFYLSRRGVFIGGHLFMMIFLLLTAIFIRIKNGNLSLLCICFLVISYQASTGSAFWIYTTEIGQDAAMGLCLFTLTSILLLQSLFATPFVNLVGIEGFYYFFAFIRVLAFGFLWIFMKETKGISTEKKKTLFIKKEVEI